MPPPGLGHTHRLGRSVGSAGPSGAGDPDPQPLWRRLDRHSGPPPSAGSAARPGTREAALASWHSGLAHSVVRAQQRASLNLRLTRRQGAMPPPLAARQPSRPFSPFPSSLVHTHVPIYLLTPHSSTRPPAHPPARNGPFLGSCSLSAGLQAGLRAGAARRGGGAENAGAGAGPGGGGRGARCGSGGAI